VSNSKNLLPPNATKLENDIADVIAARIENIPNPIRDIADPMKCHRDLLPWLAWAYSVDQWEVEWTDDIKRNVIAESIEIHRRKGTSGAIERIFDIVALPKAELLEWFEYNGEPYFFKIAIEHGDMTYTERVLRRMTRLITIHKNVRSWLDVITIHLDIDFHIYFGAAIMQANYIQIFPRA